MAKRDYYEVLGISKNSTEKEIKLAFRIKARLLHPDVTGDETAFNELAEAYKILRDKRKRATYDHHGHEGATGS